MSSELKKRILTSILLFSLLSAMYLYSFIMIGSLLIMTIIVWIEFYAMVSKIIKKKELNKCVVIKEYIYAHSRIFTCLGLNVTKNILVFPLVQEFTVLYYLVLFTTLYLI